MEIRELTEADVPSLLELYTQLDETNRELLVDKSVELWKKEIAVNQNITYFGAVDGGKVVATCYCVIIPNLTNFNQPICFIENVVTDSTYRKQGLGRKVIEKAVETAKAKHCYKVILQSSKKRTEAHQFYEKTGFNGESKKAFDMRLSYPADEDLY